MNIKTRILLSVILLQITGFALVLLNHQQRATDGILAANQQRIADESYQNMRYLDARAETLAGPELIPAALTLLQPQTSPADSRLWLFSAAGDSLTGQPAAGITSTVNSLLPLPGGNQKTRIIRHADSLLFIQPGRSGLISVLQVPKSGMDALVSHNLNDDMFISAAIALLFISAMALMLEILFKPFEQVLQRLRYAVARNRDAGQPILQKVHYPENNEFTPLAETFNTLVDQVGEFTDRLSHSNALLQREQQRVAELNTSLEQRVSDRTRELAEKNTELQESLQQLKLSQQRLVSMEKNEALGEIVAGLAHEINSPLGISVAAINSLQDQLPEFATLPPATLTLTRENLDIAANNLQRAADMIERFKQVSVDQSSEQRRDFDLGDYLHSILLSLRPWYKYRPVDIRVECPPQLFISSYPGAIAQIMTNLMLNALTHAFPDPLQNGHIVIRVWQQQEQVFLSFRDDGQGMDETTRQGFFEPFFTTCRDQGGSGLGGYIIRELTEQSLHGSARVSSTPGAGCEVQLSFPRRP
ncbi:hypothetical protein GJQ55_09955 [Venatoribacter cucullus]|uniref:histidine kinase n=1 Tax=Venatoribacter cucullus TaxID=2661630 RepID=A0A9X7YPI4_9GAMM|nr:ATP-binding protein [Venatoribacter cucullus]QQD24766.1 hypothetical protein GJQ55_09955 [Venatoribacter cucullus]